MNVEQIATLWPLFLSMVCVIAWCIRLESTVLYLRKDLDSLKEVHKEKDNLLWSKLTDVQDSLNKVLLSFARLEGKIDNLKEH